MREMTIREKVNYLADRIGHQLEFKEASYKGSWKKRGGIGAFMMLARKWDRLETQAEEKHAYDVLALLRDNLDPDGPLDDVNDLLGYLFLVLIETQAFPVAPAQAEETLARHPDIVQTEYVACEPFEVTEVTFGDKSNMVIEAKFRKITARVDFYREEKGEEASPAYVDQD